jgi:predicted alpha-1,6-mannanase (GH76 family)
MVRPVSNVYGDESPHRNRARAAAAYAAMQRAFLTDDPRLLRDTASPHHGLRYATAWPFGQAVAATLDVSLALGTSRADLHARQAGLETYWDTSTTPPGYLAHPLPPLGGGGHQYSDDNAWIALELLRSLPLTGTTALLQRAEQVFAFAVAGWDTDPTHPAPGGVFWVRRTANGDRNTVSTAPSAVLGLRLFHLTGKPHYRDWSLRMIDWVDQTLRAPDNLYWDHIDLAGRIEYAQWSYNQGTMISASVLAFQVTGDAAYLDRATRTAQAAIERYAGDGWFTQSPAFNAIFFKHLLLLDAVRPDPAYRAALQAYADAAWTWLRNPANDLFDDRPEHPALLIDQSAMVQIYALLVEPPAHQVVLPIVQRP